MPSFKETAMKKIILASLLGLISFPTMAHDWHHGGYYGGHRGGYYSQVNGGYGGGWIAPALIGGVIGYELARPRYVSPPPPAVIYQQPPVVIQQAPVYSYTPRPTIQSATCSAWTEVEQSDGTVLRQRTCSQ